MPGSLAFPTALKRSPRASADPDTVHCAVVEKMATWRQGTPEYGPISRPPRCVTTLLPDEYPLTDDVGSYLSDELGFGRLPDFGVIVLRLQQLYEWSAHELATPGLPPSATGL
jgi:hypothetical protein